MIFDEKTWFFINFFNLYPLSSGVTSSYVLARVAFLKMYFVYFLFWSQECGGGSRNFPQNPWNLMKKQDSFSFFFRKHTYRYPNEFAIALYVRNISGHMQLHSIICMFRWYYEKIKLPKRTTVIHSTDRGSADFGSKRVAIEFGNYTRIRSYMYRDLTGCEGGW